MRPKGTGKAVPRIQAGNLPGERAGERRRTGDLGRGKPAYSCPNVSMRQPHDSRLSPLFCYESHTLPILVITYFRDFHCANTGSNSRKGLVLSGSRVE